MRRSKGFALPRSAIRKQSAAWRQTAVAFALAAALAGCAPEKPLGVVGHETEWYGGAVADEPLAAIMARDTLSAGGNAVDAAVALYFGLSATYPVAAGLGGGGMCVVHDGASRENRVLDFSQRGRPAASAPPGRVALAAPANVRAMATLHARYGRLSWSQLVLPGERVARFGHRVSRALARALLPAAHRLAEDPAARALFLRRDGTPLAEGDSLTQVALASALAQIRGKGAGDLYTGVLAKQIEGGIEVMGGYLPIETMRRQTPVWRDPVRIPYRDHTVSMVPGTAAERLWSRLFGDGGSYRGAADADKFLTIAAASLAAAKTDGRVAGGQGAPSAEDGTTGFAVMDRAGGIVACWLSMNGAFGTGRMIPGTGIFAVAPAPAGGADEGVAPLAVISNDHTGLAVFAAAASGGEGAAAALALVAGRALYDDAPLQAAVESRRIYADAARHAAYVEPPAPADAFLPLGGGGIALLGRERIGRVNAIYCPEGVQRQPRLCKFRADPRGFGFAATAER